MLGNLRKRLAAVLVASLLAAVFAQDLVFEDVIGYESFGVANVAGVVRNATDHPIEFVQIVSSIYDDEGEYLDSGIGFTYLDVLLPGEWSPFQVMMLEGSGFESFDTQAQWERSGRRPARPLEVVAHRGRDQFGIYEISGQVRNTSARPIEFAQVMAAAYDGRGRLVAVGMGFSLLDVVPPGGTSPFSILMPEAVGPIERYELVTQAEVR